MNGHLGLIHSILPSTVDLKITVPDTHPSARNLGAERVGSGTIIDPDGYILTVHYVTVGAASITVTLSEGGEYHGQLAAQDQETGLALVKIPAQDLPFLKLAPADSVNLGQPVVIIAAPNSVLQTISTVTRVISRWISRSCPSRQPSIRRSASATIADP